MIRRNVHRTLGLASRQIGEATSPSQKALGLGLVLLAFGLAMNSLLGPLVTDVIEYRFSESLINQGIGLDAVSLVLVAPLSLLAAVVVLRGHSRGALLALGPASYTAYMSVQYAIGPEYQALAGNNEQFFVLHLALFMVAIVTVALAWTSIDRSSFPFMSWRQQRAYAVALAAIGLLLILRYLPAIGALVQGDPTIAEYEENATSFLLIMWMDLGIFTTAAIAGGFALWQGAPWGSKLLYGVVGWFALTGIAVAVMMITMYANDDPNASAGAMIAFIVTAAALIGLAGTLMRLLLRREQPST